MGSYKRKFSYTPNAQHPLNPSTMEKKEMEKKLIEKLDQEMRDRATELAATYEKMKDVNPTYAAACLSSCVEYLNEKAGITP